MSKPAAVLISDIHFSLPNLELASAALLRAQFKAALLKVPLVIAGDLMDTKANMRAEVVNKLIQLFSVKDNPDTIILVGNHDLINEKGKSHSLNFLKPYTTVIDRPVTGELLNLEVMLIPYISDPNELRVLLTPDDEFLNPNILIMHQGITGSNSGEYIQDKSAITKDDVAGMRVISGHYHARQTIELPDGGKWDYIGNPYTTNFGEANDPPKGFQILMDDGSLEFVPTNLRKHVVMELDLSRYEQFVNNPNFGDDLVWLKVKGTKEQLANFKKPFDCRLDLIPLDTVTQASAQNLTQTELLDQLIDSLTNTSDESKARLKQTWKDLVE